MHHAYVHVNADILRKTIYANNDTQNNTSEVFAKLFIQNLQASTTAFRFHCAIGAAVTENTEAGDD